MLRSRSLFSGSSPSLVLQLFLNSLFVLNYLINFNKRSIFFSFLWVPISKPHYMMMMMMLFLLMLIVPSIWWKTSEKVGLLFYSVFYFRSYNLLQIIQETWLSILSYISGKKFISFDYVICHWLDEAGEENKLWSSVHILPKNGWPKALRSIEEEVYEKRSSLAIF